MFDANPFAPPCNSSRLSSQGSSITTARRCGYESASRSSRSRFSSRGYGSVDESWLFMHINRINQFYLSRCRFARVRRGAVGQRAALFIGIGFDPCRIGHARRMSIAGSRSSDRAALRPRLAPVDDFTADGGEVFLEPLLYADHVGFHEIPCAVGVSGQDCVGDRLVLIEEVEASAVG
jgi:hypothetical protein